MSTRAVLAAACAAGFAASLSQGAIIRYDASQGTLPTDQGFSYTGSVGAPQDTSGVTLVHGPISVSDMSAWQKQFPAGTMNFATSTWSATMTVRLTGSDFGNASGMRRAGYSIFLSDDAGRWVIADLGSSMIGLRNDAVGTSDPSVSANLSGAFRTVTLEAGPSGARLFLDGALQTTLALGTGQTVRNTVFWGDGANTAGVALAEVHDLTLVPAPGVAGLGVGAVVVAVRRRRR
ncbi:MAG: hypothetical protein U0637_07955 [Phycisphaerales bacterium]